MLNNQHFSSYMKQSLTINFSCNNDSKISFFDYLMFLCYKIYQGSSLHTGDEYPLTSTFAYQVKINFLIFALRFWVDNSKEVLTSIHTICIWIKSKKKQSHVKYTPQIHYMSRPMGKPTICIGKNKDADQLRGYPRSLSAPLFSLLG